MKLSKDKWYLLYNIYYNCFYHVVFMFRSKKKLENITKSKTLPNRVSKSLYVTSSVELKTNFTLEPLGSYVKMQQKFCKYQSTFFF